MLDKPHSHINILKDLSHEGVGLQNSYWDQNLALTFLYILFIVYLKSICYPIRKGMEQQGRCTGVTRLRDSSHMDKVRRINQKVILYD